MAKYYYAVTVTKTLWVEAEEENRSFESLSYKERDRIITQAVEEINCGDFPIEYDDVTNVELIKQ